MNTSFSTRKHVSEEEIKSDIAKLNGIIEKLSKVNGDELTRAFTYNTELGLIFASTRLGFQIDENITILKTYSEYLKHISKTEENSGHELEESLTPYKTIKDKFPIINGFLNRIRGELQLYPYFPHNVLDSIVKFYLLKYFFEYLEESDEKNCVEITNILKYLIKITKTDLIEKKENLITPDEFSKFYSEGTTEIKGILLDFSYSIYTHTRYIKSLFTKLCIFKIVKICDLREKKSKSLINSSTGRSRNKVVPRRRKDKYSYNKFLFKTR